MSELKTMHQCYNKGCGQKFNSDENTEASCCHHPGEPVFHDAYKGWSCCNRKCTDFTEFLNIKGCTTSFHNSVKPPEPVKQKPDDSRLDEVILANAPIPKQKVEIERPDENASLIRLPFTVAPSLRQLLATKISPTSNGTEDEGIQIGTSCKNAGCQKSFEGEHSNAETCIYHAGVPIFHEGLKFWSCCKRKTTDFNAFLDQVGCKTGSHEWKKENDKTVNVSIRQDWHQTESFVYVSAYVKGCDPEQSYVEANPVKLKVFLKFDGSIFEEEFVLSRVIDITKSSVNFASSKVEIKLKKADVGAWKTLKLESKISD
ncbi:hypothetical protein CHUAL_011450 [Chamberlinius hualienensis]